MYTWMALELLCSTIGKARSYRRSRIAAGTRATATLADVIRPLRHTRCVASHIVDRFSVRGQSFQID
jgi:hypothetical protein